jgi:hypothetical protein
MTRVFVSAMLLASLCGMARADDAMPLLRTLLTQPAQLAAWLSARDPRVEARVHAPRYGRGMANSAWSCVIAKIRAVASARR